MRAKGILLMLVCLSLATRARGQTKVSGTVHCDKPSDQQSFEVGDRPHHSFMITKGACTWTKPLDLDGVQTKTDTITQFIEVRGNRGNGQGYVVNTLANPELAAAAMDAVKQWRYQPTLLNGVPVEVLTSISVNYRLQK